MENKGETIIRDDLKFVATDIGVDRETIVEWCSFFFEDQSSYFVGKSMNVNVYFKNESDVQLFFLKFS